jgi:hypothetical protein
MTCPDSTQVSKITDDASEHAEELHLASRPHKPISGKSPLIGDEGHAARRGRGHAARRLGNAAGRR